MKNEKYTFEDFVEITRRLCAPDGCPWDRTQTHESLRRFAVEEAYELVDAIENGTPEKIADESGDVLFQVVLHARLAENQGEYTIDDVTDAISRKMLRRHPDVFGGESSKDWDAIKRAERNQTGILEELQDIPTSFPALMRADKIQKKTEKVDYPSEQTLPEDADKELQLGKELFDLVAQCRRESVNPELALNRYLKQFLKDFETNYKGE